MKRVWNRLINIPASASDADRRRRLLNVILISMGAMSIVTVIPIIGMGLSGIISMQDMQEIATVVLAALLCHHSQGRSTMGGAHDAAQARRDFEQRVRRRATDAGAAAGLAAAEAFRRLTP